MGALADFRKKYPQYNNVDDTTLATALHKKYYANIPVDDFFKQIDLKPVKAEEQRRTAAPVAAPAAVPAPAAQPAAQPVVGTAEMAPLKDPGGPASLLDYFTDREAAIKQDRAQKAYLADREQRTALKDLETQTGFFDRLGDFFTRGELNARSGIKDIGAVIERDPVLKKQYQTEARRFAKDASVGIEGETTWETVKDNPLKVLPFILEQGAQMLPQLFVGRLSPLGMILGTAGTAGQVARGRAEANDRQDVSGSDAAVGIPVGLVSSFLDQYGLGEIVGTAGRTALIRTLKAAGAESGTEGIQNTLEYLGSRVGTKKGADASEAFDQALAGMVAGGGLGAGFRGTGEAIGAVGKSIRERGNIRAEAEVGRQAKLTAVDQSEENVTALVDALTTQYRRQGMTQEQAAAKAAQVLPNVIAQQTGAAEAEDVGSILSSLGPQGAMPEGMGRTAQREAPTGQVDEAGTVAEAPRGELQEVTEDNVTTALSAIDNDFVEYADDINEAYGVKELQPDVRLEAAQMVAADPNIAAIDAIENILKQRERTEVKPSAAPTVAPIIDMSVPLKQRTTVAKQIVADTIASDPVLKGLGIADTKLSAAANQLANGRQPDATTAIKAVLNKTQLAAIAPQAEVEAAPPAPPAPPSVDEVAVAPVVKAIEQASAPTGGVVPSLAETAARDIGLAEAPPAPAVTVEEAATIEPVAEEAAPEVVSEEVAPKVVPEEVVPDVAVQEPVQEVPLTREEKAIYDPADYTPQEIYDDLSRFGYKEATRRGYTGPLYGMFGEGVREAKNPDIAPLTDEQILANSGPEVLAAYKEGQQFGKDAVAAVQAPTIEPTAAPTEAALEPTAAPAPTIEPTPTPVVEEELTPEEQEQGAVEQEFAYPETIEEPPAPTPPAPEEDAELARQEEAAAEAMAQRHADDFGGIVIFRDGPIGLIRAYSKLTGKPVYIPFNGTVRARVDVESFTGTVLTEEQLIMLKQAKEQAEAADAAKDASDPFVKYGEDGLAVSASVPERVAGVVAGWKQMLFPGIKLYITTIEDASADKANFTGNTRAVGSAALDPNEAGSARKIGPGEYYIAYTQGTSISKVLELLAHEMGHVHEKEVYANASPEEKKALREAHAQWLEAQSSKSARELVLALRARVTGRNVKVGEDIPAGKLTPYWKSFSEWYADQTSRWAVSNEKPLTVVDKFFARLGAALRNFYKTLRAERYLPTETFTRYINTTLKDIDLNPMDEPAGLTYDDVLDEVYGAYHDPEGPQISEQNFNLLIGAANNQRKSPQELMDALEGFKDKYAETVLGINPYEASAAKLSDGERAARKQARAEKDARKLQYQIARSRNQGSLAEDASTLAKIVEAPAWIMDFTKDMAIAGYDKVVRGMLKVRSDSGVVRSATHMSKALGTSLQRVVDAIQSQQAAENRALTTLMKRVQEWSLFDKTFPTGSDIVTDLANASTLHDINLAKYPTLSSFISNDPKLKAIWLDPKLGENAKLNRIENRQQIAKMLYKQWNELDLPENGSGKGKAIYKMAADAYMETFNRRYNAVRATIEKSGMSDARKAQVLARIDATFASARQVGVYFPLMRFGEFWMRTGTGVNAEYSLFETERQLKQAMRGRYKDMVADGYKGTYRQMLEANEITFGKKLDDLKQELLNDPTKMLKGVYEALDANALKKDAKVLEDEIFQLYVQALPQGAQSREFLRRKGRTGFEADAIRAFLTHQRSAASQLARLEYGSDISNAVDASYALIEGDPEGLRMLPYIDTMAEMANQELETNQPSSIGGIVANWVAPKANTIAFVYLMTQTSTAMFQSAQLVMVGLPVMVREYGMGAFTQMFRYTTSLHKMLGVPMKDPDNPNAFMRYVMRSQPSINDSGYINNMKDEELKDALKFGWSYMNDDLNLFGDTFAMNTTQAAAAPTRIEDRYAPGVAHVVEGVSFAHNFMTGAMHHMERMTREAMGMSAMELEFRKLRKQGFSAEVAKERAAKKAAELTREAMFVYTPSSKPLLMRGPLASMVFQFMSFPMAYLSIISRNFFDMVRLVPSAQGRGNATIMFTGMMLMLGTLAGSTGLPFYSTITGMLDSLLDALRDEEEPEEGLMGDSNPLSYRSVDLWWRTWMLPHLFGTESTIAKGLDLSPEAAEKLQRAAEMGIPSAVTGFNMQSPLSADNMLMRDVESTGSIKDKVTKFMFDTGFGAFGSVTLQIADGIDLWQQGQTKKAVEKLTPYGMLRAPQVAARLAEEGYTTRKGDLLTKNYDTRKYDAEYYTWGKLVGQFLGVRDAEVAEVQKAQILAKDAVMKIQKDKSKVVDEISRARRAFVLKPSDENLSKYNDAQRSQAIYNIRYGSVDPITDEDLNTSYKARTEAEWSSIGGLRVGESYRSSVEDLMNR